MKQHLLAATLLMSLIALAPRAYAAMGDQSMDPAANNGTDQSDDSASTKPQAPPSPTPGSKAESAPAAEASADVSSLGPNEALFDAITRGDLAAARDAIGRGADLNAHNSLGQKPIDASIDLGRNDITFVLLAQRPLAADSAASAGDATGRASRGASSQNPAREIAEAKPISNPGTPQPAVGFLGF